MLIPVKGVGRVDFIAVFAMDPGSGAGVTSSSGGGDVFERDGVLKNV